jgi:hypothetical protein
MKEIRNQKREKKQNKKIYINGPGETNRPSNGINPWPSYLLPKTVPPPLSPPRRHVGPAHQSSPSSSHYSRTDPAGEITSPPLIPFTARII